MPKRQSTKTIETPEMQGDDSWIKVRPPTVKESKKHRNTLREIERQLEDVQSAGGDSLKEQELDDEKETLGLQFMSTFFIAWNWVDDDDESLPQPLDNPDVFESCNAFEIKYLGNLITDLMGSEDEKKD